MQPDLTLAGFLLAALLLGAGGHALREQPRRLWAAAWVSIIVNGFLDTVGWIGLPVALFLTWLFPGAQLAGALAFTRGRSPAWVAPVTLGLALLTSLLELVQPGSPLILWIWWLVPGATLASALILAGAAREVGWAPRAVGLPILLLLSAAGLVLATSYPEDAQPVALRAFWMVLAVLGFTFQLRVEDYRALVRRDEARRRTEDALSTERDRFRALTENTFDLVAELDDGPRFTYVNPRFEELLGLGPAELLGREPSEFLHPDDVGMAALFEELAAERGRVSGMMLRVRHRDGRDIWLESVISRFEGPEGEERWVLNARDATRRKAEEASGQRTREILAERVADRTAELHASEARFRALADHAPELISEFDAEGRYTFANASFRELLGIEPSDLVGRTPRSLIHPDDVQGSREGILEALSSLGPAHALHRLRHQDGSWRWFDNTGRAYTTESGELRFVSIGRDVTDARRQETERRRLQAHMQQTQRLESLHVLAGGIAHDFNNLLAVIQGNASLLEADVGEIPGVPHRLGRIQAAGRHAEALTQQLLAYSGKSLREFHALDLSRLLEETEDLMRASVSSECHLHLELGEDLPLVEGDNTELRQVVLNLVTNAADACAAGGGTIRVRTGTCSVNAVDSARAFGTTRCEGAGWVVLEVTDDGPGMDEATRERILEPFYTTRSAGRGLGLAVVLGIATAHRGCLTIESEPGRGSTFRLLLPASSRSHAWAPAEHRPGRSGACVGRVLVVDDDEAVRELTQVVLERAGFEVETTDDGRRALNRAEEMPPLDYVVLDLAMPDLPGATVLRSLNLMRPELPVIITTGFAGALAEEHMNGERAFAVLQKPCNPDELVETLRKAGEARAMT